MIKQNIVKRSVVHKKSSRMNGKTFIKIIILILTGSGLFYQAGIIFHQFMSGKTVVRLEIGNNQEKIPPAIIVCYPVLYSMEKTAKYYPDFNETNKKYLELLRTNQPEAIKYYSSIFRHWTLENLKNNGLDMKLLFDESTVKYKALDGKNIVLVSFFGDMDNN